ncbi:MAG: NRDE family protein [Phycisphaerales bacterium]
MSVIPLRYAGSPGRDAARGYRVVTNRDEQRDRTGAEPPRWRRLSAGGEAVVCPIDPMGGGTWVAATLGGLTLCLLNGNPRPYPALPPAGRLRSRGGIIPELLGLGEVSPAEAVDALADMDLEAFAPFTLLAIGLERGGTGERAKICRAAWSRSSLVRSVVTAACVCEVSSGLGDDLVQPRLPLFWAIMSEHGHGPLAQDRFHAHAWPERPEISVMMSRPDARTVSVTTVEVSARPGEPARVRMTYRPIGTASPDAPLRTSLEGASSDGGAGVPIVSGAWKT